MIKWKVSKYLPWGPMKAMQETDFWDPNFFHHVWLGVRGGAVYHDLLLNFLPELLQNVDLQTGILLQFTHDGAAPYFLLAFREFLNNMFLEQRIGPGGPTAWPARSPDLQPLYFYLWGHLQSTVYATDVSGVQDLQQRTQNGFEMVGTTGWYDNCNFPANQQ